MYKIQLPFGLLVFGAFALSSVPTLAKNITISGTHSIGEIQQKCDAAGGYFSGGLKGGGYGCSNTDAGTQIICENNGKCKGSVPAATAPGNDLGNILRGGTHPVSTTGGGSSGGKPAGNTHPVMSPPASAGANKGPSGTGTNTIEKPSGGKH
jgi:hypothetical protein